MKTLQLFTMLFLIGLISSWGADVTPNSWEELAFCLDVNFTYLTGEALGGPATQARMFGMNTSNSLFYTSGVPADIDYPISVNEDNITVTTAFSVSGGANSTPRCMGFELPSNNFSVYVNQDITLFVLNLTGFQGTATGNVFFNRFNSTHYLVNNTLNLTHSYFQAYNSNMTFCAPLTSGFGYTVVWPLYNVTWSKYNATESGSTVTRNVPSQFFLTYFNNGQLRSDFRTGFSNNTIEDQETFQATVFYQNQQLVPKITYFPGQDAYPNYYDPVSNLLFLKNNTPAYILDTSTNVWFYVPPLIIDASEAIYTLSALQTTYCTSTSQASAELPLIPFYTFCGVTGGNYVVNISWSEIVDNVIVYGNSTNVTSNASTSNKFFISINATDLEFANYTQNDRQICSFSPNETIFGLTAFSPTEFSIVEILIVFLIIAMLGLSVFSPFALFFVYLLNELFPIFDTTQLSLIAISIVGISVFSYGLDRLTFKGLIVYSVILMNIIGQILLGTGKTNIPILESLEKLTDAIGFGESAPNLFDFAIAAPAFLINVIIFILSLPYLAINYILEALGLSAHPLAQYGLIIIGSCILAFYAYLMIKAYEVLANRFREV